MSSEEYRRCFDLRCRCKRGEYVRPEDLLFLETMANRHLKEYGAMDKKVFDETKPFGAI